MFFPFQAAFKPIAVMSGGKGLGIAEVAKRSGVEQKTIRVWEARHGFPTPSRLANGRREYAESDVELLREIVALRETGLSLPAAIERVRGTAPTSSPSSIFAGLRMQRPDLAPGTMPKGLLTSLSRAIEDEYCANAERGVVFGSFQSERHYRAVEGRWKDLSETADLCCVFADFDAPRRPAGAPIEAPLGPNDALIREWSVICDAPRFSVCLLARERPGQSDRADPDRLFDMIWSAEPEVTRAASRTAMVLARDAAPDLVPTDTPAQLEEEPRPSSPEVRAVTALTNRMLSYAEGGSAAGWGHRPPV